MAFLGCIRNRRLWLSFVVCLGIACLEILNLPSPSTACPFCSPAGQTLTREVDQASMVLFGTLVNAKLNADAFDQVFHEYQKTGKVCGIALPADVSDRHAVAQMTQAVERQLATGVVHTSTLYLIRQQVELAEKIARLSGIPAAKVFLVNSGTEANDTAVTPVPAISACLDPKRRATRPATVPSRLIPSAPGSR